MDGRPAAHERIDVIVALVADGYADRLTLSQDSHCYADFSDIDGSPFSRDVYPQWVHSHVVDDIVPALLERGVTEEQVRQIMVENPRRVLGRQNPY
jgi:phosphotriesterase-related protein